jgi:hypothetical protein
VALADGLHFDEALGYPKGMRRVRAVATAAALRSERAALLYPVLNRWVKEGRMRRGNLHYLLFGSPIEGEGLDDRTVASILARGRATGRFKMPKRIKRRCTVTPISAARPRS